MDEMSSEGRRTRFLADERTSTLPRFGEPVSIEDADSLITGPAIRMVTADVRMPTSRRWKPQNWRLRTKLIVLAAVPTLLAIVLGALRVADSAQHSRAAAIRDAIIIGAVLVLSLVLLTIITRSIVKPLRVLRASAFDVADRQLPAVIEQLRFTDGRGAEIRVDAVPVHSREDVGQVARAFDAVYSEAVRLASEQAALRANVNDMFVNLSRRSQGLVERQLQLIDQLELGEQDSDRLSALFRLDHLATRMRRNGENLLVLGGAELRQRSGEPVPLVDVLRAAVSEIEDYQRIALTALPRALVSSLAVNDIVHLIAELIENATAYSDPETQVSLSARFAEGGGLAVEIVDAGTGIRRAQLVDINQRLAAPPAVDVSVSRQMGLYVVGRLASRHRIAVVLDSAHDFGVTAIVTLPRELVTAEAAPDTGRGRDDADRSQPSPSEYLDYVAAPGAMFGSAAEQNGQDPLAQSFGQDPAFLEDLPSVNGTTDDTPIFNDMLSRWFTNYSGAPPIPGPESFDTPPLVEPEPWESAADVGWQAAEAASEPIPDELTAAGLPKRRPQAFLVPGSADPTPHTNGQAAPPPARHAAAAVRDRMSDFQRGLLRGRHTKPVRTVDDISSVDDGRDYSAEGDL